MADVNIRTVADLLGHSTIQMTMRYAHLAPEHNQAAVDKPVAPATGTATTSKGSKRKTNRNGIKLVKSAV